MPRLPATKGSMGSMDEICSKVFLSNTFVNRASLMREDCKNRSARCITNCLDSR